MKRSKVEIAAIVITVIFIAITGIYFLHDRNESAAVTISSGRTVSSQNAGVQSFSPQTPEISPFALVNINTATAQELCSLPGIGETLSARIIAYRSEHGLFKSIDEIMSVSGIGAKTYQNLKSYITVD